MLPAVKTNTPYYLVTVMVLLNFFSVPPLVSASDWFSSKPATFSQLPSGGFVGKTEAGEYFSQSAVVTNSSIRLQRFEIGSAVFYISDKGAIRAHNDLMALSIYNSLLG